MRIKLTLSDNKQHHLKGCFHPAAVSRGSVDVRVESMSAIYPENLHSTNLFDSEERRSRHKVKLDFIWMQPRLILNFSPHFSFGALVLPCLCLNVLFEGFAGFLFTGDCIGARTGSPEFLTLLHRPF